MTEQRIDVGRAAIGWRLAAQGDEQDAANWAYDHMDALLDEVQRLQAELAQAREQIAEREATNAAHLRAMIESHMDMGRGDWVCAPVIGAAREFWQWHLRGQPGTPDTLYPMTYAAQDAWQEERARLENALFAVLAAFDAAQQEDTA